MKYGIFNVMQQRRDSISSTTVVQEAIDQARVADQLGYDSCWFPEHHSTNYSLCPSPLMMVAHCAGVTERIRLGTGVIVAPLYHPMRLLAEIGFADIMSGGRLDLGIGAGYQPFEFERFGIDIKYNKEMTLELLDLIKAGISERSFSFDGDYFQQMKTSISVKPFNQGVPPIWLVGSDPRFYQRAATENHAVFVSGLLGDTDKVVQTRANVNAEFRRVGRNPKDVRFALLRYAFVGRNRKDVERYAECARYQTRLAYRLATAPKDVGDDYIIKEVPFEGEPTIEELMDRLIIGDVDTCIERAVNEIRRAGVTDFVVQSKLGDLPHDLAVQSLQLWMEEVVPAIKEELAGSPPLDFIAPEDL